MQVSNNLGSSQSSLDKQEEDLKFRQQAVTEASRMNDSRMKIEVDDDEISCDKGYFNDESEIGDEDLPRSRESERILCLMSLNTLIYKTIFSYRNS